MTTREDVQAWLDRLELPVESVAEDIWLVRTEEGAELAVNFAPPVLVLRVRVTELPADAGRFAGMARQLLQWNARAERREHGIGLLGSGAFAVVEDDGAEDGALEVRDEVAFAHGVTQALGDRGQQPLILDVPVVGAAEVGEDEGKAPAAPHGSHHLPPKLEDEVAAVR